MYTIYRCVSGRRDTTWSGSCGPQAAVR